jgi:hypothetical protein
VPEVGAQFAVYSNRLFISHHINQLQNYQPHIHYLYLYLSKYVEPYKKDTKPGYNWKILAGNSVKHTCGGVKGSTQFLQDQQQVPSPSDVTLKTLQQFIKWIASWE